MAPFTKCAQLDKKTLPKQQQTQTVRAQKYPVKTSSNASVKQSQVGMVLIVREGVDFPTSVEGFMRGQLSSVYARNTDRFQHVAKPHGSGYVGSYGEDLRLNI